MATEPRWLDRGIVEALHADQIAQHGGGSGLRDEALLESALTRPQQRWHDDPTSDLGTLAAAYGYGLVKNHPFVDGNKRASLVTMYAFLAINGQELDAPETAAVSAIIGAADGSASEEELADWIRSHLVPWEE
ncbi:type II toxin-antitoxin system death-on-curing family toxin [Gaopeijia maritima]|uniref:type II toxin-antitoxin system death-on-curing family toxin n=1 Tax=Gaopeijia maritima TaxID=3119007 RepID=UPI0032558063